MADLQRWAIMIRYVLFIAAVSICVRAEEITNEKPRFKIRFPEGAGWSPIDHQVRDAKLQDWSAKYQGTTLILALQVFDAPIRVARPTFRENAEDWSKGAMKRFTRKISSQFATLAGRDAYQLVASLKTGKEEFFYSTWMIQVDDVTYSVMIISSDSAKLSSDTATEFLKSFGISK